MNETTTARMPRTGAAWPALLFLAALAASLPAAAYEALVFQGQPVEVTAADLLPHAKVADKTFYSENYLFNCDMDGKAKLQVKLGASNVLGKSGSSFADVSFSAPGLKSQRIQKTVPPGKWSVSTTLPFKFKGAGVELAGDHKTLRITAATSAAALAVDLTSATPGWKPGNGRIEFGDQGYFSIVVWPSLEAKGTITDTRSGKVTAVSGTCIFNHAVSTLPPEFMPDRWFYFRSEGHKATLLFQGLLLPEAWGAKAFGWALVSEGGKLKLAAPRLALTLSDARPRGDISLPWAIIGKDSASGIDCALKASKLRKVVDRLKKLPAFEAALVRKFINPVRYLFDASMECAAAGGIRFRTDGEYIIETLR
ncbi:MAG: hypothetical protein FJ109_17595 [Deltaproteobacteria bacterium]|nr:hypothetical protein [Deltaproteobacteria bacterium]